MKSSLAFIILINFIEIWACSLIYDPPDKFDPNEYIFIGKVIDHVASNGIEPKHRLRGEYHGFLVEVEEEIYLPKKPKKYFEIYPLSLGPDCSEGPYYRQYIELFFPIDSKVRIVAKKTRIEFDKADELNIQLEVSPHNQFTLSLNLEDISFLVSTKESIFSYVNVSEDSLRSFSERITDSLRIEDREQKNVISHSVICQKDFELRKDLCRLHMTEDDKEKTKIIYRLKNFKYLGSLKLLNIISEYIKDQTIKNKLIKSLFQIREKTLPIEWVIGKQANKCIKGE